LPKTKYKSKFEVTIATSFRKRKLQFEYEPTKFKFTQPEIERIYTPDFWLPEVGVYVESKGKLTPEERKKLIWWRQSNPDVPLVILFMRGRNPIRKGSDTSYIDWARKNGFEAYEWEEGLKILQQKKENKS
jgi:hypothetical protein